MDDDLLLRYSRHILLPEVGVEGQQRLLDAQVLVLGAGGLGSPAAYYLASAGIGHIVLADGDAVDLTNLQRQILHTTASVGKPKPQSGQDTLASINPHCRVTALCQRLEGDELSSAVASVDAVLDCSDNFATRHAVNRACVEFGKPLISGAAIRFDGQIAVFDARDDASPCYQCLFPDSSDVGEMRCAVMGVFAPLTGIIGCMQAAETLKLLIGCGTSLAGRLLLLDGLSMTWRDIRVPPDPACKVCGDRRNRLATASGTR